MTAWRAQGPVVAVVAAGGALGACARYGASLLWPTAAGGFPWTTLCVNAGGCALMGVLMVVITEFGPAHPLVRPFLGTGVLGGFTTFSAYAVDVRDLLAGDRVAAALAYLALTPAVALVAVATAAWLTRRVRAWRLA
ncbi:fluoride efflux transporter CrcB [Streptomyces sp. NPDC057116]|uniref:fluoride efflux transporter CrcB n=1 Tax=Streptomyces sp. NPDC057116 TaxID=3346023 RepID=UPI003637F272